MSCEKWEYIDDGKYYMISSCGNVKSMPRVVIRSNGRPHKTRERILKPAIDACGYHRVALSLDKLRTYKVHRLVAQSFVEGDNSLEVNHIDGDKLNNNSSNLEWVTRSENQLHAYREGLQKPKIGQDNPTSKLKDEDIPKIREMFNNGMSSRQIARLYNMDKSVFLDIRNNKRWTHV